MNWKRFLEVLGHLPQAPVVVGRALGLVFVVWGAFFRSLCKFLRGRGWPERPRRPPCPDDVPPVVRRNPDPCLYSQPYLQSQGVKVTWNNPDIVVTELDGTPAPSNQLEADHDYLVQARIWNASFYPAFGVYVRCEVRDWGIGGPWTPVQIDPNGSPHLEEIDIGPWTNSQAVFRWHTPAPAGHFCLRIEVSHPDDKNPANNIGQENTRVVEAKAGQMLSLPFHVFNSWKRVTRLELMLDAYEIPEEPVEFKLVTHERTRWRANYEGAPAPRLGRFGQRMIGSRSEGPRTIRNLYVGRDGLYERQRRGDRGVPAGWEVRLAGEPLDAGLSLAAGQDAVLDLMIQVPAGALTGRQRLNVTVIDRERGMLSGVTIDVEVQ